MKNSSLALAAALAATLSGAAMAQETTATMAPTEAPEVSCAEILATPSASATEIATLNDTSVITVLRCQDADAEAAASRGEVADLRTAVAANPTLAPRLSAAGSAPDQVVAFRRNENGEFALYVIGAYR